MSGENADNRQHQRAIRIYKLRLEGVSVRETAKLLGVHKSKIRTLQLLGERLLSLEVEP